VFGHSLVVFGIISAFVW